MPPDIGFQPSGGLALKEFGAGHGTSFVGPQVKADRDACYGRTLRGGAQTFRH